MGNLIINWKQYQHVIDRNFIKEYFTRVILIILIIIYINNYKGGVDIYSSREIIKKKKTHTKILRKKHIISIHIVSFSLKGTKEFIVQVLKKTTTILIEMI